MKNGALLGLIAPHSLSNIELLVPLMMDDASDTSAVSERYERARVGKDTPFSYIPSSAFVLDESPPTASQKHKRGQKHSRKQDLAYRPRSIYLESIESAESDEQFEHSEQVALGVEIASACSRLMRTPAGHQNELLLLLCSELQDAPPSPPLPPAPPAPCPDCACWQQGAAPLWLEPLVRARRGLVPIGENSYQMPHHMPNWDQE